MRLDELIASSFPLMGKVEHFSLFHLEELDVFVLKTLSFCCGKNTGGKNVQNELYSMFNLEKWFCLGEKIKILTIFEVFG